MMKHKSSDRKYSQMKVKKKIITILCAAAVLLLSSVNLTYAWQTLNQTALNVNIGTQKQPELPPEEEKPEKPPEEIKPPAKDETTENAGQIQPPTAEDTTQSGQGETKTGDTLNYLPYMIMMLVSFALMSLTGGVLIVLLIHGIEQRRK